MSIEIRWPMLCTRCGSLKHYAEDCKVPTLGLCAAGGPRWWCFPGGNHDKR
mgnify:CR=1 FL=1